MWPISPPAPTTPDTTSPLTITPPPTPVPMVTITTFCTPLAEPSQASPIAAALASFSYLTTASGQCSWMAILSSGRLMAMFALTLASPDAGMGHGTARPMPDTKARGIWALATTWSIASVTAAKPAASTMGGVGTLALASRLPSSSNRPSLTEVPPTSMPM